jgi:AraC-like DNA-binding protein
MLALANLGALRRAEVTALTLDDIDPAHRLIRIHLVTTKSPRERVVYYGPDVTPVLVNHFRQLKQAGLTQGALFRSFSDRNYGLPLSVWNWSKIVRRWALDTGLPHITTYTFRHLRLTHLSGSDLAGRKAELPMPQDERLSLAASELLVKQRWDASLSDLADIATMSARTFSRLFIKDTSFSFRNWKQRARICAALDLLANGIPIKQIAWQLGFSCPSTFTATFRTVLRKTPGEFMN